MTDKIRAAYNKGFAIAGVACFADTFVQGGSLPAGRQVQFSE
jgi:hypothetical protein